MAHEITHIVNRDVAIMTLASFFASIASTIVQFGFFFGGGFGGNSDNDDDNPSFMVVILVSVARLRRVVPADAGAVALPRVRRRPRRRGDHRPPERAELGAAQDQRRRWSASPTQDLRAAGELNAFFIVPASLKNSIFNLFATHPPMEKRIEALSRLEAQLQSGARPVAA